MTDDDFLNHAAESLDDAVMRQLRTELAGLPAVKEYEYLVLADSHAKIYVSKTGTMTRLEIAAQLRRLADYIESLTDEQAHRP